MPLGMLMSGLMLEYLGIRATIIFITAGSVLVALSLVVNPVLHGMDRVAGGLTPDTETDVAPEES
jgi:hypothetical protein